MNKPILIILLLAVLCGAFVVRAQENQKPTLKFKVPAGWVDEERSSSMRVAQYKLPHVEGDAEDGSLVLYYFGKGQGGSTSANIERWASQMQTPEGAPKEKLTEESFASTGGLKITAVDAKGTYVAETAPGSGTFHNKPGYRLRAAVIETPNGSYFVKFVGPEKTVTRWDESFMSYLRSFEFK
jgi:hypothetical protein